MKRRDEVLVGMTATLAILAGVLGALWLARGGLQPGYPLYAKFTWGAGLKQGQPVLLSGMTVGNVDRVILHPDGYLIVRLRIHKAYKVPLGTTATIEPNGFFGDQLVALKPSRPNMKMFATGDTILSGRPTPQIGDVLARVDTIAGHLSTLAAALNRQMVDSGGFTEMRRTLRDASALMLDIRKVAANQDAELSKTQASLRHAVSAIDSTEIDSTLRALKSTSASVTTFMTDLRETTAKLNTTLAKLNEGNGSAAKLLNDPAFYNRLSNLAAQTDSLLADFKKNPRKYIKLSIF
jgi:phospholipid/cholesterol/gamma-HCH transport system substrate-binding protein